VFITPRGNAANISKQRVFNNLIIAQVVLVCAAKLERKRFFTKKKANSFYILFTLSNYFYLTYIIDYQMLLGKQNHL